MEGKSLLFKLLGDVEVVPVCIHPRKTAEQEITDISNMLKYFKAVNLEDITAPQCFAIEKGLKDLKQQPIFHDDQHGTAIVTLAAFINAINLTKKQKDTVKVIVNGAGAAGVTIAYLLMEYGVKNLVICDTRGVIYRGRKENMNEAKTKLAEVSNPENIQGDVYEAIKGADFFVGVSKGNILTADHIKTMAKDPVIFAMANPTPEIGYEKAKEGGAFIFGSGRSDLVNQINNSLVFPGIFKGLLKHNLGEVTEKMKINVAVSIANTLKHPLTPEYIMPDSLDKDVAIRIAEELGH